MLRVHHEHDPAIGVRSDLIIYLDESSSSRERIHCLGIRFEETVRQVGKKLAEATNGKAERLAIYHLPWGFRFFCPHDRSHRRMLIMHSQTPGMQRFLKRNGQYLDGILCVSSQLRDFVRGVLPEMDRERIEAVGYPIAPPAGERSEESLSAPIRLGFIGRLHIEQKRIERIPQFCGNLENLGVNYNMDVMGDGANRDVLEKGQAGHNYVLRGTLQGPDYWQAVRALDCLVFFSDYEGTPISMLEALSQGVIPIYPRIKSGGDAYVERIAPELLYEPADMQAAAAIVQNLSKASPEKIAELRARCRKAAEAHSMRNYLKGTFDFARRIWEMPRISVSSAGAGMKFLRFLSLKQLDVLRKLTFTPTR